MVDYILTIDQRLTKNKKFPKIVYRSQNYWCAHLFCKLMLVNISFPI